MPRRPRYLFFAQGPLNEGRDIFGWIQKKGNSLPEGFRISLSKLNIKLK